jgi:hypothetical protein
MIAIVTVSKAHFIMYCQQNNLNETQAAQVARLSDVKNKKFTDMVLIDGSNNVTDYVISKIRTV